MNIVTQPPAPTAERVAAGRRIRIRGTVQGVGFRPWVYRLAGERGIRGSVRNDAAGVTIEAWGDEGLLDAFCDELRASPPPAASVDELRWRPLFRDDLAGAPSGELHSGHLHSDQGTPAFTIVESGGTDERRLSIPPDLATCPECLAEIGDPSDRRHGYAFTNCTNCGPRFTIALDVPYDRPATTMAGFALCAECAEEYAGPLDRRFHAQPNACPVCGPRLWLEDPATDPPSEKHRHQERDEHALEDAARALRQGRIVAVKGLGGFHLACRADDEAAVSELRRRKGRRRGRGEGRREKPFAVMVPDLETARRLAHLCEDEGKAEARLLQSVERPIVLLRRRTDSDVLAPSVAPDVHLVGLMLPYTPLHHLLLEAVGSPLVMTSGNVSEEPIAFENDEARRRLGSVADLFLAHDRPIARPCDDSVVRVVAGVPTLIRRSRGWVPRAIPVRRPFPRPVLACGGHLKNVVCLGVGDAAYLGPHVGDLESPEAVDFLERSAREMETLLGVRPELVVHDLHPDYESTRFARRRAEELGVPCVAVQHHHAHVLSAAAEHGLDPALGEEGEEGEEGDELLGIVFDGTGWGPDGTAWGGEILHVHGAGYRRLATLRPLNLAGGEAAIRRPWRLALALLDDAFGTDDAGPPPLAEIPLFRPHLHGELPTLRRMMARGINAPLAHGAGRYFDAVGALLSGVGTAGYEGHLALRLESLAAADASLYPADPWPHAFVPRDGHLEIDLRPAVRRLVRELLAGRPAPELAARFHATLATAAAGALAAVTAEEHLEDLPVALTGGCFQNDFLTRLVQERLSGRRVLRHRQVPPGDGGLALGQAVGAEQAAQRLVKGLARKELARIEGERSPSCV